MVYWKKSYWKVQLELFLFRKQELEPYITEASERLKEGFSENHKGIYILCLML